MLTLPLRLLPLLANAIPLYLGQLAVAVAPRFLDASSPASECTGGGWASVKDIPRIALLVSLGFKSVEFSIRRNWAIPAQSGGVHRCTECIEHAHVLPSFPW